MIKSLGEARVWTVYARDELRGLQDEGCGDEEGMGI